ncbi:MAG: DUF6152 family protein [Gammaproteobacteria bacterium]
MNLKTLVAPVLAGLAASLIGFSAGAHHSTAMFEWGKEKKLEGTIDKFQWTQPHTFIWVNVPDKGGKVQQWGFEGMSPSWLGRHEWNSHSLQSGQKVSIDYYPLRDGRTGGFFVRIKTPDGKTLEALPGRPATPGAAPK